MAQRLTIYVRRAEWQRGAASSVTMAIANMIITRIYVEVCVVFSE